MNAILFNLIIIFAEKNVMKNINFMIMKKENVIIFVLAKNNFIYQLKTEKVKKIFCVIKNAQMVNLILKVIMMEMRLNALIIVMDL